MQSVIYADVAELADALDLGSSAERRVGSSPSIRTKSFYNFMAKILLISSKAYPAIAARQILVMQSELQRRSIKYDLIRVPQAIDIGIALSIVSEAEDYDGVIIGGVIIGNSPQQLVMYEECIRSIYALSLDFAWPTGCAIIYGHSEEEADQRLEEFTTEALTSCFDIMELKKDLQSGDNEQQFRYQN